MKMKVFQIAITREESKRINAGEKLPKYKAHCDALVFGEFPGQHWYDHVATITTDGLDEAFQIGNIGPEERITRHAPMHSVSVGDVLVNAEGRAYIVKSFGFERVDGWMNS